MTKIQITQVKSGIDRCEAQKHTLKCLGLTKMNSSVVKEVNPQVMGMVKKVQHLVEVKEL